MPDDAEETAGVVEFCIVVVLIGFSFAVTRVVLAILLGTLEAFVAGDVAVSLGGNGAVETFPVV